MSDEKWHWVHMEGDPVKALAIIDWLDTQGWESKVLAPILSPWMYLGGKGGIDMASARSRTRLSESRARWSEETENWNEDFGFEKADLAVAFKLRFEGEDA